jgi:hypothetical protein
LYAGTAWTNSGDLTADMSHEKHAALATTFIVALEKVVVVDFLASHHKAIATSMSFDVSAIVQCLFRPLITACSAMYPSRLVHI